MAKKPKSPAAEYEDEAAKPAGEKPKKLSPTEAKKIVTEAVKKYKRDAEADRENRKAYKEDMLFTYKPGEQWEQGIKDERGKDRPMYEFNESRVKCMTVINHIRANRPAAKIRGVEENDKQMAEIRQGLYLNITNNSDFDSTKDYAAGHQVAGGYAVWRIDTEYSTDTAFDQDIVIRPGINPLCYLADSRDKDELKRNAKHWFVHTKIPNDEFDAKYPEAERSSFEPEDDLGDELDDEDSTWVAEYWVKKPVTKTICLLSDGKSIDKDKLEQLPEGVTVAVDAEGKPRERKVNTHKICQYIISASAVLEGPNEWAGSIFPFVPVYGYYLVIDGKVYWGGLTRYLKDAQRAHNWAMTSVFEAIGNAPQAQYWATVEQAKGNVKQWAEAHQKNLPALLYNVDPQAPGPPQRMGGADVPVALIQAAQMSSAAMNTNSGITLANEGRVSNETSGKAIRARQDEGMVATFNFGDNMAKSERRTCEIINDLLPHIYDTERNIRILGKDGAEQYLKINSVDPVTKQVINDISAGKFDFTVTTGPSYATQRQEAAEFYTQLSQSNPAVSAVAGDLIVKAQDYPMADAIAERLKLTLPPQIQQAINKDKPMPPEVQMAMAQVDQAMQQVQMQAQAVQQAAQEAASDKAVADKAKSDNQIAIANLRTEEAKFAKDVADFKTLVAQQQLQMAEKQGTQEVANEREQLTAQVQQALAQIQTEASSMLTQFAQTMAQIQQGMQPQVVVANQPRPKLKGLRRENGNLVAEYDEVA
jgi:hypothetical protein